MIDGGFLEKIWGSSPGCGAGSGWVQIPVSDVVLHNLYNIHRSAINETNVIRLATELRFVELGKPFD